MAKFKATSEPKGRLRWWRIVAPLLAVPALVAMFATPSGAQTPSSTTIPENANFTLAGMTTSGKPLTTGAVVSGELAYCNNANGLGSELYFNASDGNGITVQHATVSPMVIPLHIGITTITDPTNEEPISDQFVTLGVVEGTPAAFGTVGPASATYGGLAVAKSGVGVVSFNYTTDSSDCTESHVMPILQPVINGDTPPVTTTAPVTTTTAPVTTTTAPVTTTTAPATTTTAPVTTTTAPVTTTTQP